MHHQDAGAGMACSQGACHHRPQRCPCDAHHGAAARAVGGVHKGTEEVEERRAPQGPPCAGQATQCGVVRGGMEKGKLVAVEHGTSRGGGMCEHVPSLFEQVGAAAARR